MATDPKHSFIVNVVATGWDRAPPGRPDIARPIPGEMSKAVEREFAKEKGKFATEKCMAALQASETALQYVQAVLADLDTLRGSETPPVNVVVSIPGTGVSRVQLLLKDMVCQAIAHRGADSVVKAASLTKARAKGTGDPQTRLAWAAVETRTRAAAADPLTLVVKIYAVSKQAPLPPNPDITLSIPPEATERTVGAANDDQRLQKLRECRVVQKFIGDTLAKVRAIQASADRVRHPHKMDVTVVYRGIGGGNLHTLLYKMLYQRMLEAGALTQQQLSEGAKPPPESTFVGPVVLHDTVAESRVLQAHIGAYTGMRQLHIDIVRPETRAWTGDHVVRVGRCDALFSSNTDGEEGDEPMDAESRKKQIRYDFVGRLRQDTFAQEEYNRLADAFRKRTDWSEVVRLVVRGKKAADVFAQWVADSFAQMFVEPGDYETDPPPVRVTVRKCRF